MLIGFDKHNLQNAVAAVMASAAEKGQKDVRSLARNRRVDLTNPADVQAHLIERVEDTFKKACASGQPIQIARIEEVVYSPVGFVYELHNMGMHPPPLPAPGGAAEDITHLAYFWSTL